MRSIEKHLLKRLLIGQGVLWLIASTAIWLSERSRLYSEFDNELRSIGNALRYHLRDSDIDEEVESRWPGFLSVENGGSFQAWYPDGSTRARSANLGDTNLLRPFEPGTLPTEVTPESPRVSFEMMNFSGTGRESLRGVKVIHRSQGRSRGSSRSDRSMQTSVLLVAKTRSALKRSLLFLILGVVAAGAIASAITAALVRSSVFKGLAPLLQMGEKASSIDVRNLETRFDTGGMPVELAPISSTFNELLERIEEGFRRERRFSSDAAHELRTPLAEIKSISELMVKWPEETTPERQADILDTARHMERLLESLTKLAKWESDEEAPELKTIATKPVVENSVDSHREAAAAKKVTIKMTGDGQSVATDPMLFQLILSNLIANAVEYTPEGGAISLELGHKTPEILSISNSVVDFDPEHTHHLAERFWRADGVRTGNEHCGLGLSIVSACIDQIGWNLSVDYSESAKVLSFRLSA